MKMKMHANITTIAPSQFDTWLFKAIQRIAANAIIAEETRAVTIIPSIGVGDILFSFVD